MVLAVMYHQPAISVICSKPFMYASFHTTITIIWTEKSCIMLKDRVRQWIVPLGIKDWLIEKCDVNEADIEELKWWDETRSNNDPL